MPEVPFVGVLGCACGWFLTLGTVRVHFKIKEEKVEFY
jgi:hypothetical protein